MGYVLSWNQTPYISERVSWCRWRVLSQKEHLRVTTPNSHLLRTHHHHFLCVCGHWDDSSPISALLDLNEAGKLEHPRVWGWLVSSERCWNSFSSHLLSALSLKCHWELTPLNFSSFQFPFAARIALNGEECKWPRGGYFYTTLSILSNKAAPRGMEDNTL